MQRWTLIVLLAIGILIAPLGVSVTHADYPVDRSLSAHQYLAKLGYSWVFGDPHSHSTLSDGKEKASVLLELATKKQGFCFLTDHAEQLSADEIKALGVLAASFQRTGTMAGVGFEWTGTPDYLDPQGRHTNDPAEITGPGHMLVYDSEVVVRQMAKSGDAPVNILPTFPTFLDWVGQAPGMPLVAFAHPSLYRVEESFDQDGDGQGFDPPPADSAIVDRAFGCELSSHTYRTKSIKLPFPGPPPVDVKVEGYRGLGDGNDLASSNEAGFRELLRGGWRVSPLMSTDWHLPGYAAGPYTGVAVRERSINGVLDGFYERLTCGTEAYGVSIALLAWQKDRHGRVLKGPIAMGEVTRLHPKLSELLVTASIRDKTGKAVRVEDRNVRFVVVCAEQAYDIDTSTFGVNGIYLNSFYPHYFYHLPGKRPKAVYAKATLGNGKQLISAPVFFRD